MSLKKYKPTTASLRHTIKVDKGELHKGDPFRYLTVRLSKTGGRNNQGQITAFHRGGGVRRLYRKIDFKRSVEGRFQVERLEYDPNRSAFIALLKRLDCTTLEYSYVLAPDGLSRGSVIETGSKVPAVLGSSMPLKYMPVGALVHNIELYPGKGGQFCRAAGTFGEIIEVSSKHVAIRLVSSELRAFNPECRATVGVVSNLDNKNIKLGKAGVSRWLGRRPIVRGVAMNPIDHPHGGGEGKSSGGRPSVTPWGKITKGQPTARYRKSSKAVLKRRQRK